MWSLHINTTKIVRVWLRFHSHLVDLSPVSKTHPYFAMVWPEICQVGELILDPIQRHVQRRLVRQREKIHAGLEAGWVWIARIRDANIDPTLGVSTGLIHCRCLMMSPVSPLCQYFQALLGHSAFDGILIMFSYALMVLVSGLPQSQQHPNPIRTPRWSGGEHRSHSRQTAAMHTGNPVGIPEWVILPWFTMFYLKFWVGLCWFTWFGIKSLRSRC